MGTALSGKLCWTASLPNTASNQRLKSMILALLPGWLHSVSNRPWNKARHEQRDVTSGTGAPSFRQKFYRVECPGTGQIADGRRHFRGIARTFRPDEISLAACS